MTGKLLTAATASIALASASVQAAPTDPVRTGASVEGEALAGDGLIIALLAAAVVGFVVVVATEDEDLDLPTSP